MEQKIKKYRKKPIVIEAYQTDKEMIIHTLEGDMKASVGGLYHYRFKRRAIFLVNLIFLIKLMRK